MTVGWEPVIEKIKKEIGGKRHIIVFDTYTGVHLEEICEALNLLGEKMLIEVSQLYKDEKALVAMTDPYVTDDVLFGYRSPLTIGDYFDDGKLAEARCRIEACDGLVVVVGTGAAIVVPECDTLIYADMARWEIQQRFRAHSVEALGIRNSHEAVPLQYKRGYFNDWQVCDRHKQTLYGKADYWVDTHIPQSPKLIDRATFLRGMELTVNTPFRVVPFFDPAPWGGQWMKGVCALDPGKPNYGWCFDCVPEENSLFLEIEGERFEMPAINLVFRHPGKLLGNAVVSRFGAEFPIRFDFLDTVEGSNLSLQVHPTDEYIREKFGMPYTQDESYYILDAREGAEVYLGLKTGTDKEQMLDDLCRAERGEIVFDAEKYVNKFPAKKHDHYLIPGGTVHCSGAEALVLEISSTPNLFTFKLWDWQRLGLDGKPRPINIGHGRQVIRWERDTGFVESQLVNQFTSVAAGEGWREETTGLHAAEFIETRRHWFTRPVLHNTDGNLQVLNLIEGEEAVVESPSGSFSPFVVHYAETFIIPAHLGAYTITPCGKSQGKECGTIKAYVRS